MIEFQKKKKIRKIMYSPYVLIILTIIFFFILKGSWSVYQKALLSEQNLQRNQNELKSLNDREKTLAASIDYLKTDQGVESEIRSKFRAVKEGEKVAVIIDDQATISTSTASDESHGFWYRLFHWFML